MLTNSQPVAFDGLVEVARQLLEWRRPVRVHVEEVPRRFDRVETDVAPQVGVDGVLDDRRAVLLEERPYLRREEADGPVENVLVRLEPPRIRGLRSGEDDEGNERGYQPSHVGYSAGLKAQGSGLWALGSGLKQNRGVLILSSCLSLEP